MSGAADNDKGYAIEYAEKGEWKLYGEYGSTQRRTVNREVARLRQIGYEVRVQGLAFDPRDPAKIRRRS